MRTTDYKFDLLSAVRRARIARWVTKGNTACRSLDSSSLQLLLNLDDLRLLLNRVYCNGRSHPRLLPFRFAVHEKFEKSVKEFCGGLLERCTDHPWWPLIRRRDLRTRSAVSATVFLFRKVIPGSAPSVGAYVIKMTTPQQPPPLAYISFVRELVRQEFPRGWDRAYWNHFRSFTLPVSACRGNNRALGGVRGLMKSGDPRLSRPVVTAWQKGIATSPIPPGVCVIPVQTGGKWRLVSKSDAQRSFLAPLHRAIYDHISKKSWLLRGEAIPSSFCGFGSVDGELFVSGDYESATDNLNIHVSRVVLDEILSRCTHVPLRVREEAVASLVAVVSGVGVEPRVQSRGQLMGNLLSFPLLCISNYLAYRYCADREGVFPVRINGDDIVFRAPPGNVRSWFEGVGDFGLAVSRGKTLVFPSFFSLNSTFFIAKPQGDPERVPVIRSTALFPEVSDPSSLSGRLASLKAVFPRGWKRDLLCASLVNRSLGIAYLSQRSFRRGLRVVVSNPVLRLCGLHDRERFYLDCPRERPPPPVLKEWMQCRLPRCYVRSSVGKEISSRELETIMVDHAWSAEVDSVDLGSYWDLVREGTYSYRPHSKRSLYLYSRAGGDVRALFDRHIKKVPLPKRMYWVKEKEKDKESDLCSWVSSWFVSTAGDNPCPPLSFAPQLDESVRIYQDVETNPFYL